jgi:hypothetical protein
LEKYAAFRENLPGDADIPGAGTDTDGKEQAFRKKFGDGHIVFDRPL